MFIYGESDGFIEFKLDPVSGGLRNVVVIDLPPLIGREIEDISSVDHSASPAFDRELWPWKVTPDYSEIAERDIDMVEYLAFSESGGVIALWFSNNPVESYLVCGEVKVGVTSRSELVNIVTPKPPISEVIS
ncbi:hypothetical protein [Saccharomonospora iraqiensis]|uniref:hypothetical protein n=1 Tax=Saccharomonospora iraqiensis TaxID=52698 RepID=UPI0012FA7891|nr:hypothetical protein [Saccharomonospora iraqiensis]